MAQRGRNETKDLRDWLTRARDDLALAENMPEGTARDEAINKAKQLRTAAEMMRYLESSELKPPN